MISTLDWANKIIYFLNWKNLVDIDLPDAYN